MNDEALLLKFLRDQTHSDDVDYIIVNEDNFTDEEIERLQELADLT